MALGWDTLLTGATFINKDLDIQVGQLFLSFTYVFGVMVWDIWEWIPGSYGRAGGRVGWVQSMGKNPFREYVPWKTLILYISMNADILVFWQKRRARKNAAFWRALHAEISRMRPIQARKLKLIKELISQ